MKNKSRQDTSPIGPQSDQPFLPAPGVYVTGMWSVELPKHTSAFGVGWDLTLQLRRENHPGWQWHLVFRYRHFRTSDQVFDGNDMFRWNDWIIPGASEDVVKASVDNAITMLVGLHEDRSRLDYLPVNGGLKQLLEAVDRLKPHWFHVQVMVRE